MNIKRFLIINSLAVSLLGASVASAQSSANVLAAPMSKTAHSSQNIGKKLTIEQRSELAKIKRDLRVQMNPLIRERHALSKQIRAKIATPNEKWSNISVLLQKRNAVNMKIGTLWAKTQFQTYQKLGILFPVHHGRHCNLHNKK